MFAFRIRNFIEFLHAIFLIPFILHRLYKIIFFAAAASTSYISPLFLFSMFSVHIKIFSHHPQWAMSNSIIIIIIIVTFWSTFFSLGARRETICPTLLSFANGPHIYNMYIHNHNSLTKWRREGRTWGKLVIRR